MNQAMDRAFQCGRCFGAHIEKKKSRCDYHFHGPLTEGAILDVERAVNEVIDSHLPVTESYMAREEAHKQFVLDHLPVEADPVRIIRIGDYDACPCNGPHVRSTGEIGRFRVSSYTLGNGVLRIRYKLDPLEAGSDLVMTNTGDM